MPKFITNILRSLTKSLFETEITEASKVKGLETRVSDLEKLNEECTQIINEQQRSLVFKGTKIEELARQAATDHSKIAGLTERLEHQRQQFEEETNGLKETFFLREQFLIESNWMIADEKERFQKLATTNGAEYIHLKNDSELSIKKLETNLRTTIIQLAHHNSKHRIVSSDLLLNRFKGIYPDWFTKEENVTQDEKTQ